MIDKNYIPKLYKSTANMTVKEWENERRNSIGGSDMAVLLGLNHFGRTKRELFYDKTVLSQLCRMKMGTKVSFSTQDIFLRKW